MKIKGWDIGLLFLLLLVTTIGVRVYYINYLATNTDMSEDVYNYVIINIIFQTITIVAIFWYIYHVTKKYFCFRLSMILTVFPAYIRKISSVDYYNMVVLLWVLLIIVILLVSRKINAILGKNKKVIGSEEDSSMSEILTAEINENQVKMLDNPLPVPKRREHREMDFAIELTPENDDFDIKELPEGDDFDI